MEVIEKYAIDRKSDSLRQLATGVFGNGDPVPRRYANDGVHLLFLYQHGIISQESAIAYANDASLVERLNQPQ